MSTIAIDCTSDIFTKLKLVDGIDDEKILDVISEDDFVARARLLKTPFVGVLYEGLRANAAGDPSRQGLACDLYVGVALALASKSIGDVNSKSQACELLTLMRNQIKGTKSPSGHFWRFASEAYVGVMNDKAVYLQRWVTAVVNP